MEASPIRPSSAGEQHSRAFTGSQSFPHLDCSQSFGEESVPWTLPGGVDVALARGWVSRAVRLCSPLNYFFNSVSGKFWYLNLV